VLLLLLARTGMFLLRDKGELAGRVKWSVLDGLLVPALHMLMSRYLT
jgi:hypothetical protein